MTKKIFVRTRQEDERTPTRKTTISLRVSDAERNKINLNAALCNMSASRYIRNVVLGYEPKQALTKEDYQKVMVISELRHHLTNLTNYFQRGEWLQLKRENEMLNQQLKRILNLWVS